MVSTDVKSVRGSKGGTSYAPVVRYRYTFGGQQYESERVLPINISASRRWAEGMCGRFHSGQAVTAYANPSRPSSAYLVHELSLLPLAFVGFPLVICGLFSWIVWLQRRQLAAIQAHTVPIVEA